MGDHQADVAVGATAAPFAVGPGYGRASLAGAEAAGDAGVLVFMDGDGADDPSALAACARPDDEVVVAGTERGDHFLDGRPARAARICISRFQP
jgi:hypothetical protein